MNAGIRARGVARRPARADEEGGAQTVSKRLRRGFWWGVLCGAALALALRDRARAADGRHQAPPAVRN